MGVTPAVGRRCRGIAVAIVLSKEALVETRVSEPLQKPPGFSH
jgi:hypothetical protein